mmetsp:Transcript_18730/g.44007  ORF Transcript_18730/g.44007 Transcript_18730/m.44007 type:complete len:204 (-) Transcript_18730:361-972(-)
MIHFCQQLALARNHSGYVAVLLPHALERIPQRRLLVLNQADRAKAALADDTHMSEVRQLHLRVLQLEALHQLLSRTAAHDLVEPVTLELPEQHFGVDRPDSAAPGLVEEQRAGADVAVPADDAHLLASHELLELPSLHDPEAFGCLTHLEQHALLRETHRPETLNQALDLLAPKVAEQRHLPCQQPRLRALSRLQCFCCGGRL